MHGQTLALSPGLFFSLNVTKEMNRRTDECVRKIGLVFIAGVAVHMRQPLPRFLAIVYVCKLRGFSGIFSVYSCIPQAAPWLLNCSMAFRALTRRSLLKPRQEALMHLYNGVMLYASSSTIYIRLQY